MYMYIYIYARHLAAATRDLIPSCAPKGETRVPRHPRRERPETRDGIRSRAYHACCLLFSRDGRAPCIPKQTTVLSSSLKSAAHRD